MKIPWHLKLKQEAIQYQSPISYLTAFTLTLYKKKSMGIDFSPFIRGYF
ncbi:hypothetical protein ADICYQ_0070 [Cyclobacterium qasimii M12-11B]|uniref:Uncharacterized protein n=1 Tax=Cyclobacterium qasimii M12-11B TaxID=641524 RepID=S7VR23_9BACT|nr:hypothetical protein ADICYQ_0070 [Cyclobacterium qasimii M12-11B]